MIYAHEHAGSSTSVEIGLHDGSHERFRDRVSRAAGGRAVGATMGDKVFEFLNRIGREQDPWETGMVTSVVGGNDVMNDYVESHLMVTPEVRTIGMLPPWKTY